MEINRGMPSGSGVSGGIRSSASTGHNPPNSSRAVARVSSPRVLNSGATKAQADVAMAQRLPMAVQAQVGRMVVESSMTTEMTRAGRAYASVAGPQPQLAARGQLATAHYQAVANLEQRTAIVEMMGIDTFA